MERLKRQMLELTERTKGLASGFSGGSEAALGAAKSLGLVTLGVGAASVAMVKGVQALGEYTNKMQGLGKFADRIGIDPADIQSVTKAFERSGVSAEDARKNIAGMAGAMADLGRQNSELAKSLLSGLQGENRNAMQAFIEDLRKAPGDIAAFGERAKTAAENVFRNNLAATNNPALAAEAKANFLARLGVPDVDEVRETLQAASDAAKAATRTRIDDAAAFNTVTTEISQSWTSITDSVKSLATPAVTAALRPIAEQLAISARQIGEAVTAVRNFTPPEWLAQIGTDLKAIDAAVSGALNSMNEGAAQLGRTMRAIIDNFQPPEWLSKLIGAADTAQAAVHGAGQSILARHETGAAQRLAESQAPAAEASAKKGFGSKLKGLVGRAEGGPLDAGQMSIVGENGPELFQPSQGGHIIPTWMLKLMTDHMGTFGMKKVLQTAVNDSRAGHPLRTKLRGMLGLHDPGEDAPWQKVAGRATGGPVTSGASYMVGEGGPEAFVSGGGGGEGKRLIAEQTHQMQELVQNTEDQSTQTKALTEEIAILNRHLEGTGGGGGGAGGPGRARGGGVSMGGLSGLPGGSAFGGGGSGRGGGASGGWGGGGGSVAGGGGSSGGGGASASWGGDDAAPSMGTPTQASGGDVPAGIIDQARKIALEGGPGAVDRFMREQGHPRAGAWCGQFAASVVKSQGLQPPKNPGVASNWANWGEEVTGAPQAGDVAVRAGAGGKVNVGRTGSHVTFVSGHDPQTGRITTIGGNQSRSRAERNQGLTGQSTDRADRYVYRRAPGAGVQGGQPSQDSMPSPAARGAGAASLQAKLGISPQQYDAYRETLAGIESGGKYDIRGGANNHYTGRYQFGQAEIRDTARKLGENAPTRDQFQKDPAMQERYLPKYMEGHHDQLMKSSPKYRPPRRRRSSPILGYSHNQGAGGLAKYLRTGQEGRDAFGTSAERSIPARSEGAQRRSWPRRSCVARRPRR